MCRLDLKLFPHTYEYIYTYHTALLCFGTACVVMQQRWPPLVCLCWRHCLRMPAGFTKISVLVCGGEESWEVTKKQLSFPRAKVTAVKILWIKTTKDTNKPNKTMTDSLSGLPHQLNKGIMMTWCPLPQTELVGTERECGDVCLLPCAGCCFFLLLFIHKYTHLHLR